jgi:hypothetical protein
VSKKELLLTRLQEIANSIEKSGHALALIALGSVGLDTERMDDYSDLDYFLIAENGYKDRYINSLDWLSNIAPVAYQYRNTADGHKVLFQDGVFCEFAVFERKELSHIPFAPGRVMWKREGVGDSIALPAKDYSLPSGSTSTEWLLGEVLSSLYAGMSRHRRGEKLAAASLVQGAAVARLIELHELSFGKNQSGCDPFSNERRFEARYPEFSEMLPSFMQGYLRTSESAREILSFLNSRYAINERMQLEILGLL